MLFVLFAAAEAISEEGFSWGQDAPAPEVKYVNVEVPVGGYVEREHRAVQTEEIVIKKTDEKLMKNCVRCSTLKEVSNLGYLCTDCTPTDDADLDRPFFEFTRGTKETQTDMVSNIFINL